MERVCLISYPLSSLPSLHHPSLLTVPGKVLLGKRCYPVGRMSIMLGSISNELGCPASPASTCTTTCAALSNWTLSYRRGGVPWPSAFAQFARRQQGAWCTPPSRSRPSLPASWRQASTLSQHTANTTRVLAHLPIANAKQTASQLECDAKRQQLLSYLGSGR